MCVCVIESERDREKKRPQGVRETEKKEIGYKIMFGTLH